MGNLSKHKGIQGGRGIIATGSTIGGRGISIPTGGGGLLLDQFGGAAAAYSVRLLSSTYTGGLVRVRRSSDNSETDVLPDSNNEISLSSPLVASSSSFGDWIGANNGFVVTWYDQSGNGNNATQSSASLQPQIVSSGSLITEGGKAATLYGVDTFMDLTQITPETTFANFKIDTYVALNYLLFTTTPAVYGYLVGGSSGAIDGLGVFDGTSVKDITGENLLRRLGYWNYNGTNYQLAQNGAAATDVAAGIKFPIDELGRSTSSLSLNGKMQEVIMYESSQSANKTAIEDNINAYYSIY